MQLSLIPDLVRIDQTAAFTQQRTLFWSTLGENILHSGLEICNRTVGPVAVNLPRLLYHPSPRLKVTQPIRIPEESHIFQK